jgi:hypothetical protein
MEEIILITSLVVTLVAILNLNYLLNNRIKDMTFFKWLLENPNITKEDAKKYLERYQRDKNFLIKKR